MAKKTNKTEHVLSLISKAKETNQTEDDDVEIQTIDSKVTQDLSFVDLHMENETELSEKIKEKLVQDDQPVQVQSIHEPANLLEKVVMDAAKTAVGDNDPSLVDEHTAKDREEPVKEQESYVIKSNHKEVQIESLPDLDASETFVTVTDTGVVKSIDEHDVTKASGQDYCYINVLESIVKDRVETYMRRFGVCTCPRCIADTIALTLNGLPSKYVVTDKDSVSPMVNYFDTHYSGAVTTQLSRACVIVKNNPHH
ncbi:MAG TPA: hypothetical protein DIC60_00285 [Lachnospiraceae bacterium]|nr:hypothetical protein [Lachnospiraceae bacterium]